MPVTLWKPIKPGRFRQEAFTNAFRRQAELVADGILLDFLLTVSKWHRKPKFEKLVSVGPNSIDILVGTDDTIYRYVSEGTKPHRVPREGVAVMAFQPIYKAKTQPGVISSSEGGPSGPVIIRKGAWTVGGIEPRKFEETIGKKWKSKYRQAMLQALRDGARASGHGIK